MSTLSGGPNIVTNGLVLNLDAANTKSYISGSTAWNDISQGGNNGTLVNGPTFNSANGGSIVFDGTNDHCILPNNINLSAGTGDFTFNSWIYPTNWSLGSWNALYVTAITNGIWVGKNSSNQMVLRAYGVTDLITYSILPTINTWINLTISRIGTSATMYYNGVSVASTTTSQNFTQNTTYVGSDGPIGGSPSLFSGRISNIVFYKGKGLNSTEVLQNYNATKTRFGL
jgi:hypothetical protein